MSGRHPPGTDDHAGHPYDPAYTYDDQYAYAEAYDDEWYAGEPGAHAPPRRRRRTVTFARLLLVLVLIGAVAVALYGVFFDRTRLQIPLTVSGLAVSGVAFAILALMSARGAAGLGRRGSGGKALIAALFGGLCAFAAAGSLAGAVVLGILAGTG